MTDGDDPDPDPERARMLRDTAADPRGTGRGERVAAMLYRVSDLSDPDEETTPAEGYHNMRTVLRVTERGPPKRDRD